MKNFYCTKCGEKMILIKKEGALAYMDFSGNHYFYSKEFNKNNGKLLKLYTCPFFGIVSEGWVFKKDRRNGHDRFPEDKSETE